MALDRKHTLFIEAILCSFAFMIFSFFIHYEFPFCLLSVAALIVPAYLFSRNLQSLSDFRKITVGYSSLKITIFYCIAGLLLGILFAVMYRWHLDISLFPKSFHLFVIVAALIGSMEELVFRGFIQDYLKSKNGLFSILFSSISHTGYKCCLFLSPAVTTDINIGFLAFWTFIGGILFGTIKHFSKSLLPSLIAHALFDILVYAEYVNSPWWVW
jgi:membrane protease YdiL (CAAX protease family)